MGQDPTKEIRRAVLGLGLILVLLIGSGIWRDYDLQRANVKQERASCTASIKTSRLQAESWEAHITYLSNVLAASSVKGDVKKAAREANETHTKTVAQLRARARRNCVDEYPAAKLLPF